MNIMSI